MRIIVVATAIAVSACSAFGGGYTPVVDAGSSSAATAGRSYSDDLAQCQAVAGQRSTVESAAVTGLGAAAVGAAGGAIVGALGPGSAGRNAALGAALGGLGGTVYGAVDGEKSRNASVRSCMAARGWSVVAR